MWNCDNCNKIIDNKKDIIIPCFHCYKIFCEECYIKFLTTEYKYNCINCKASLGKEYISKYFSKEFIDKLEKDFIEKLKLENCLKCKDGILYLYKEQIICNKCKSIFCSFNKEQIYPEKIDTIDFEYLDIISINNPLYSSYTEEQKLKTKNLYRELDKEYSIYFYKFFKCPYCRSLYTRENVYCDYCKHLLPFYCNYIYPPNPIYKLFIEVEKKIEFIEKYKLIIEKEIEKEEKEKELIEIYKLFIEKEKEFLEKKEKEEKEKEKEFIKKYKRFIEAEIEFIKENENEKEFIKEFIKQYKNFSTLFFRLSYIN